MFNPIKLAYVSVADLRVEAGNISFQRRRRSLQRSSLSIGVGLIVLMVVMVHEKWQKTTRPTAHLGSTATEMHLAGKAAHSEPAAERKCINLGSRDGRCETPCRRLRGHSDWENGTCAYRRRLSRICARDARFWLADGLDKRRIVPRMLRT